MMPESAITMPESVITMPGIADHHAGTGDHDGLELAITFDWNARSQWAGLRNCRHLRDDRRFARPLSPGNEDRERRRSMAPALLALDGLKCSSHVGEVDVVCL
jgi:hypothetical protein